MPDQRHSFNELLVGADHAIQPPAVVVAPDVDGIKRLAVIVARRLA